MDGSGGFYYLLLPIIIVPAFLLFGWLGVVMYMGSHRAQRRREEQAAPWDAGQEVSWDAGQEVSWDAGQEVSWDAGQASGDAAVVPDAERAEPVGRGERQALGRGGAGGHSAV